MSSPSSPSLATWRCVEQHLPSQLTLSLLQATSSPSPQSLATLWRTAAPSCARARPARCATPRQGWLRHSGWLPVVNALLACLPVAASLTTRLMRLARGRKGTKRQLTRAPFVTLCPQIAARELRLVQVHHVEVPSVGQPATFQLLRRPRDGITPELAGGEAAAPTGAGGSGGSSGGSPGAGEGGAAGWPATGSPGKGGSAGQGSKAAWSASGGSHSGGGGAFSGSSGTGSAAPSGRHGKGGPWKGAATATACNRFSKFTMVSEANATAMWVAEAERLAQYAAQVRAACFCSAVVDQKSAQLMQAPLLPLKPASVLHMLCCRPLIFSRRASCQAGHDCNLPAPLLAAGHL